MHPLAGYTAPQHPVCCSISTLIMSDEQNVPHFVTEQTENDDTYLSVKMAMQLRIWQQQPSKAVSAQDFCCIERSSVITDMSLSLPTELNSVSDHAHQWGMGLGPCS